MDICVGSHVVTASVVPLSHLLVRGEDYCRARSLDRPGDEWDHGYRAIMQCSNGLTAHSFLLLATVTFRPLRELLPRRSTIPRGLLFRWALFLRGFRCRLLPFLSDELRQLGLDIFVVTLLPC